MVLRIAVGGMQHESNSFAPSPATLQDFEDGGGWPGIQRGETMFDAVERSNIPVAGAIETIRAAGHQCVPLLWAAASPSAPVTRHAYETLVGDMLAALKAAHSAHPLDGVYLDLHGAMLAEHLDDGEGELLGRVRACVGADVPVVASLDYHANITQAMLECSDGLTVYRSYPHVDMAHTGARAARRLLDCISKGLPVAKHRHAFDYLVSIVAQATGIEPMRSLLERLEAIERAHPGVALELAPGFPMADFAGCGMSALAYALHGCPEDAARAALDELVAAVEQAEPRFAMRLWSEDEAIAEAESLLAAAKNGTKSGVQGAKQAAKQAEIQGTLHDTLNGKRSGPVVLADTQDNPGAGGDGNTTGLLAALVRNAPAESAIGVLIDPPCAAEAHRVGVGGRAHFQFGLDSGSPLSLECCVEALGDGRVECTGPFMKGFHLRLGPMAHLVEVHSGLHIAVASHKCQTGDQQMFRHVGIEPRAQLLLAVKSSVHFRADFEPIAHAVLVVRSPGPALADPSEFPWHHLRTGLRLKPMGPAFHPDPDRDQSDGLTAIDRPAPTDRSIPTHRPR